MLLELETAEAENGDTKQHRQKGNSERRGGQRGDSGGRREESDEPDQSKSHAIRCYLSNLSMRSKRAEFQSLKHFQ